MSVPAAFATKILDHLFGGAVLAQAASITIDLFTAAGIVTGNGYAGVVKPNDVTFWGAAANGSKSNIQAAVFPTATADWTGITEYRIKNTATNELLAILPVVGAPITVTAGAPPWEAPVGALTITAS